MHPKLGLRGEHGEQLREVAPAGRCVERVDDLSRRRVRGRRRRTQADPCHDHALTVAGGAITVIRTLTHPDRLVQVVPSWVA